MLLASWGQFLFFNKTKELFGPLPPVTYHSQSWKTLDSLLSAGSRSQRIRFSTTNYPGNQAILISRKEMPSIRTVPLTDTIFRRGLRARRREDLFLQKATFWRKRLSRTFCLAWKWQQISFFTTRVLSRELLLMLRSPVPLACLCASCTKTDIAKFMLDLPLVKWSRVSGKWQLRKLIWLELIWGSVMNKY